MWFSAWIFSSRTWPKAFVTTKPGEFSCPQLRPLVRMDDTRTIFGTFAWSAASTSLTVPRLSTAWAAASIVRGLIPGTKPVATTTASTPSKAEAICWTSSFTTSSRFKVVASVEVTPATCWIMAPRTATELSARALAPFSTSRTPPTTDTPSIFDSLSTTRRPVCPVAPATNTVFGPAARAAKEGSITPAATEITAYRRPLRHVSSRTVPRKGGWATPSFLRVPP
mmetsp:Transcript_24560/g.79403  ORF Transcript_24560/g.79403 Transcript_24560/m.79403 type:complete len:225 (-) Transcript_24560:177-851(-)